MSRSKLELLQFIEAQRADYRRTLPEKMAQIETLWDDARQAGEAPDQLNTLERLAHGLHGTAGTYGFHDLSHAGHALEQAVRTLIEAGSVATGAQQLQITQAISALRLTLPAQSWRALTEQS